MEVVLVVSLLINVLCFLATWSLLARVRHTLDHVSSDATRIQSRMLDLNFDIRRHFNNDRNALCEWIDNKLDSQIKENVSVNVVLRDTEELREYYKMIEIRKEANKEPIKIPAPPVIEENKEG